MHINMRKHKKSSTTMDRQLQNEYRLPESPPIVTADPLQDAHSLLAVYPMASVTPSIHVARHLNNLSISGATPSFIQPALYPRENPPPYTEYASEVEYLSAFQMSADDLGYWDNTRGNVLGLVRDRTQAGPPYLHHKSTLLPQSSSYYTSPFAQSIFQSIHPSASYPTPPPGITTSSSSLAFALGDPASSSATRLHEAKRSAEFFGDFLTQKTREMNASGHESTDHRTPLRHETATLSDDSPDHTTLKHIASGSPTSTSTPRKRKPVVQMESPTVKRLQSTKLDSSASLSSPRIASFSTPPSKKAVTLAYVEIPPSPWLTPSSSQKFDRSGGPSNKAQTMEAGYDPNRSPARHNDPYRSSTRRTGDRDDRAPLEKLVALFEEVFEAEDALPPDINLRDLPSELFSPLTIDCSRPMLHHTLIRKLTKYVGQVTRPTKRFRSSVHDGVTGGTPRRGRMAEVDTATLSRILKILEQSVRAGEDLDPFLGVREKRRSEGMKKGSKRLPSDSEGIRKSQSPNGDEESTENRPKVFDEDRAIIALTEADLGHLTKALDVARDSILAADCCIALLGSDRLTKQLYSEELITACLGTIKNQLTKVIYPFVEASADASSHTNPLLQHLVNPVSSTSRDHRRQLHEIFQALSAVLPRTNNLICAEGLSMSDSIIIQAVYIAIGPFFVVEPGAKGDCKAKKDTVILNTLGKSAMRGLRLDALSLIRNIFAKHEDQRSWIIEEILMSLIKLSDTKQKAGQFRLRDGQSIRTVSALLLQLVQTSAHDVRIEAQRIGKARQQLFAIRRQESFAERNLPFLDEHDIQEIQLYSTGLESATKAAKTIVFFLTQRSGKGKATKNSNEAEYRAIFDNLISDLLVVLYWPEWPAASLLLCIACKYMISSLDDVKTNVQVDNNAAKTIALDHLGVIAARLRSSTLKIERDIDQDIKTIDEILSSANSKDLEKLLSTYRDISSHLCKRSSEDQAYDSARELQAAILGQEFAAALKRINHWVSEADESSLHPKVDRRELLAFGTKMKDALRDIWKEPPSDVFNIGSQEEVAHIDQLAEKIGAIQVLKSSFHPILNITLLALDAPPVFMRTKAIRALGQIVMSDVNILSTPNVRCAIESHLLDSSPAVRDAAVELIGKYIIDSPDVSGDYYQKIADRMADTGLGVRKRVIKLLKSFYWITEDIGRRVDISTRLILRMLDEDTGVRDLAIKTMEELWFQNDQSKTTAPGNSGSNDVLLAKAVVIMGASANFKDRHSPFENMLRQIMAGKEGTEASLLHARYAEICEVLIDGLVDASDLPGFTIIDCMRTIYLFSSAYPAILSGSNASILLPYLKNATTAEEQATSDYLLKIFRTSLPHLPKTAIKFGHELQLALQPMIIKPATTAGVLALQETVPCLCAVVQNLTHDFVRLVALVKSCNDRLQHAINRSASQAMTHHEVRALSVLIFIISLLGEHCNFDKLSNDNPVVAADLNMICQGSIVEHIYDSLLKLYEKFFHSGLRGRILQCLGFLFRAQPNLMILDRSAAIMDDTFASPEDCGRGRLLKIIQDFLVSESAKYSARTDAKAQHKPKSNVNMEELVGNTDEFADSGVSSAVVQRYLHQILQAALSQQPQIQATAIDVLSFTIKLGLAHPLQSFPVIVALETSPNAAISARAAALHAILHHKHASLLNTRYTLSAKTSFDYQRTLSPDLVQGYRMQPRPTAILQSWYSLVREKRVSRQDFLKAMLKVFDVDATLKASQEDVEFARYMAENFSAFDYKTQEEVLTVIKHLTSILSTAGMQLVEILSPSRLLVQLSGRMSPPHEPAAAESHHEKGLSVALMKCSVIIGIIMLLKTYLKSLYGISEDKCSKYVSGKKTTVGDKLANKRNGEPISWDRLPFATHFLTADEMNKQKSCFLDIWDEDGLAAEPEDDPV